MVPININLLGRDTVKLSQDTEVEILLPVGYVLKLYLESSGNQYIDSNIIGANDVGIECKCVSTNTARRLDVVVMGECGNATDARLCINWITGSTSIEYYYLSWNSISHVARNLTSELLPSDRDCIILSKLIREPIVYSINMYNNRTVIADDILSTKQIDSYLNGSIHYSICLFAAKWRSLTVSVYCKQMRIYDAKITKGAQLVRHFIPCLDNNSRPCMYDLVSKLPFYNQGIGEFLYG